MPYPKRTFSPLPEGKRKQFNHSPTTITEGEYEISISNVGRVKIIQNHENEEFDEIECPASLIYKIINILAATRKTTIVDKIIKEE